MSSIFFSSSNDEDEDEVNSELSIFTEACQAAYEASKPKIQRTLVERDRYGAHDRLVAAYFSEHPQYGETKFRQRFRMSQRLFTRIVREVTDAFPFFQQTNDCTGKVGATTARDSLLIFCRVIMNLYGEAFLRKPTYNDMEKLYVRHDEKHGFRGMLGSNDCI
nr:hypothetical protein [Tanacetum cinerariifolium]